jgi:WD40 repeat protein
MSEPSLEQSGGVLAAPPPRRRWLIVAAAAALALAAACVAVVLSQTGQSHTALTAHSPTGLIATLSDPGGRGATSAAFSPDDKTLAVLDKGGTTHLWDIATQQWAGSLSSRQCAGSDAQVLFSPDGKTLAVVGSASGNTCLWDVTSGRQVAVLNDPSSSNDMNPDAVTGGAFSPSGAMLAIGDSNGHIYLWNVATASQVAALSDPSDGDGSPTVLGVAFGPGGTTLADADADIGAGDSGDTYVWNVPARKVTATLSDPGNPKYGLNMGAAESVAFGQDGIVAVGDGDDLVVMFDAATGRQVAVVYPAINVLESNSLFYSSQADVAGELEGIEGPVGVTVALSQEDQVLAAGVDDGYGVGVWTGSGAPAHKIEKIASLTDPGGDNSQAPQLALNPAGTLLAVVDHNGRTYLWHVRLPATADQAGA